MRCAKRPPDSGVATTAASMSPLLDTAKLVTVNCGCVSAVISPSSVMRTTILVVVRPRRSSRTNASVESSIHAGTFSLTGAVVFVTLRWFEPSRPIR